jgi:Tfp pilus assembly protein PilO
MTKSRRRILAGIIQWLALGLTVVDAVLYFALLRPLRAAVAVERNTREGTRAAIRDQSARVERLKKFQTALPDAGKQVKLFVREHVPTRRRGFSRAARLVRRLTQESGLQLANVSYRLDPSAGEPFERLGIDVTVEGPYRGLLKFAHGLETGSDFVVVRDFAFQPIEAGNLELRLNADMYLEP